MASNQPNVVTGSSVAGRAFQVNANMLGGYAYGDEGQFVALSVAPVAHYSDKSPALYLSSSFADNSGSIIQAMNKLAEDINADAGGDVSQLLASISGTMPMYTDTNKQIANSNLAVDTAFFGPAQASLSGDIDLGSSTKQWKDLYVDGTANLDVVDIDGAVQADGTITVGVDDTGYDVKFFGDTAGAHMLWDASADDLKLVGAAGMTIAGDLDVDGTANLDVVDIDGAVQADGTITVGVDDTGYDVKFFGDTAGAHMLWDASADDLKLVGAAGMTIAGDLDVDGTTNLDAVDIDGNVQADGTITVGVDDTGYDVKFFGDTAGAHMLWDASADDLKLVGAAGMTIAGDLDVDGTTNLDAVDIDGNVQADGTITVGVDDTGYDVKFFGATAGSFLLWDESVDSLLLTDSTPIKIGDAQDLTLYHDGTDSYITNAIGALKIATETSGIAVSIGHTTSETTVNDNFNVTGASIMASLDGCTIGQNSGEVTTIDNAAIGSAMAATAAFTTLSANNTVTFAGGDMTITSGGVLTQASTSTFTGDATFGATTNSSLLIRGSDAAGTPGGKAYKIEVVGGILKATQQ